MLKQPKLIVIAGLSGVGKTYLIEKLMGTSDTFIHFSAGSLIKKRLAFIDRDKLRSLSSNEVLRNQYVLIEQLKEEMLSVLATQTILFDAHMIIDTESEVVPIPFDIFEQLNPSKIIFIHDSPEIILDRRDNDSSRDRPQRTSLELTAQQNQSLNMAENYARQLRVDFKSIKTKSFNFIREEVTNVE